jgi:dTDP-4-dehydrorhamnose reductase
MKILVTGSNGLLGQKLTELLHSDKSIQLIATARGSSLIDIGDGEFHSLDISDAEAVERVLLQTRPDVILNTAAMTMVDKCETEHEACWTANVKSMENLIRASKKINTHLIQVSTDFIFDGSHGPLDETEKGNPVNFYGKSKLAAEELLIDSGLSWGILRTVLVFGITQDMSRSNIVLWVKESLEKGKTIQVVNDQWRTPTLAEDLAKGCVLAAKKKAKGIYNISGKDFMTPYDIAIKTAEFFNLDKSLIKASDSNQFKQPAARPLKTGFIIDKARKELGYEPLGFMDALTLVANQVKQYTVEKK